MVTAQLVVANGLGLEEGLEAALESAEADGAAVMEVAPLVEPIEFTGGSHGGDDHSDEGDHSDEELSEEEHAHDNGSMDPHFWHDAGRMAEAAELIGAELAKATGDDAYAACGTEARATIVEADEQVREILAEVTADQRVLVTDHDALGYFADAYDFEVAGVVIPGGATLAEPSSQELSELVETIETEGVQAIFSNTANPTDLVPAVAAEAGTEVDVVELYIGSLGPDGSGADTYVGMVTTNAKRIAAALG
jgi:ABC-type Zn uptake system ZnuABC Zn-binding protein ZnuA